MVTKDIIEEYTKYIDPSEMIIEYYKNQTTAGLEKYFLQIEDWIAADVPPEKNQPLIIRADEGIGKKTLLVQWMQYHQQKSTKNFSDVIISHFAGTEGNNENYFYAIYKILVRLREHFNVSQKVELLEDKLERYFHYWLDVCSRALAAKIVDDSTIILVFEGINLFRDPDTREEANVGLWLPKHFPARIKVIITAESDSAALTYFEKVGCEVITIESEPLIPSTLTSNLLNRPSFIIDQDYKSRIIQILGKLPQDVQTNSLFIKTYLSMLLPYPSDKLLKDSDINKEEFKSIFQKIDFHKLETLTDIYELNSYLLDYFSQNIADPEKFKGILVALNITEKGLSEEELLALTNISQKEWRMIVAVFKTFMMNYKDLWKINNETFKKVIRIKYTQDDPGYATKLHNEIAEILNKKTSNSIRKLEEETYHLFMSKNYFKLKEAVSNIENFLLLFNPNNKYDLCRYWQNLEQRGFDPSSEYTKAVEGFELHYRPTQEDTFMIILQVSRFLKEFSDFETNFTPQFRHPPIRGGTELKEIGLRREIKKLGMYQPEEWEPEDEEIDELEELEHKLAIEFPDYNDTMIKEMAKQIHSTTIISHKQNEQKKEAQDQESKAAEENEKRGGKLKSLMNAGKDKKSHELFLLNPIEALNVDIPDNRDKFRAYFGGMKRIEKKKPGEVVVVQNEKKERFLDEDESPIAEAAHDDASDQRSNFKKNVKGSVFGGEEKKDAEGKEGGHHHHQGKKEEKRVEVEPTFYYYKRWLWMMYPWVCLSSKNNFSKIIYECFSSATEYISVPDEREKTRQALKIAIEAKLKKQAVMAPRNDITGLNNTRRRNDSSLGKSQKTILPPIDKSSARPLPTLEKDTLFDTSNSSKMRLDTLSPVHLRPNLSKKLLPQTTTNKEKDAKFFITSDVLTPHYITEAGNTSMEPSMIGKVSPTNTTFQSTSLLNRTNLPKDMTRDKSMSTLATNRKVEEMLRNANEVVQTLLLPKYQDSLLATSGKQVEDLETKIKQLQTQYDEIAFMNKTLGKKYKDLTGIEENLKGGGAGDVLMRAQMRYEEVGEEIQKAEKLKEDAVKQGQRLSKIIMVCIKNKSQNVLGVQSLNYLLNNFKKMINWEKEDLENTTKAANELEKLSKQFVKAYEERFQQQERAMKHIRQEKMSNLITEKRLDSVYDSLEKTAIMTTEDMKRNQQYRQEAQERKQRLETLKKKYENTKENIEELREMHDKIESVIGLDFNSPKFEGFIDYIEKINDFQRGIYEGEHENEKLKEEQIALSSYLETLKKAKSSEKKVEDDNQVFYKGINDKDKLLDILKDQKKNNEALSRDIAKRTQLILNSKMVISKICKELDITFTDKGIESTGIPQDEIIRKVEETLASIEETVPAEDFENFKKGELDMNVRYQTQKDNFEIEKRFSDEEDNDIPETNIFKKGSKFLASSKS